MGIIHRCYVVLCRILGAWRADRTGTPTERQKQMAGQQPPPDRLLTPTGEVVDIGLQKSMELMEHCRKMAIARMEMECERALCCYHLDKIHMDRWGHAQDALSELESQIAKKLPF